MLEITHRERGANRALRVISEGGRRPEDAHHRVADELLDDAAERLDLAPDGVVVRHEDGARVLRIELFRTRREADQVDEDHADEATFLSRRPAAPPQARLRTPRQKRATSVFSWPQAEQSCTVTPLRLRGRSGNFLGVVVAWLTNFEG